MASHLLLYGYAVPPGAQAFVYDDRRTARHSNAWTRMWSVGTRTDGRAPGQCAPGWSSCTPANNHAVLLDPSLRFQEVTQNAVDRWTESTTIQGRGRTILRRLKITMRYSPCFVQDLDHDAARPVGSDQAAVLQECQ